MGRPLLHGLTKTADYKRWQSILNRCYRVENKDYHRYGGRGITVCDRWRFGEDGKPAIECYLEDMGPRPPKAQTERIDNDGPYAPGNCRWATRNEQARNRKNNRLVTAWGVRMTLVAALERAAARAPEDSSRQVCHLLHGVPAYVAWHAFSLFFR